MTFNRGKSIYFFKKVCNRLTVIKLTRKGMIPPAPPAHRHTRAPMLPRRLCKASRFGGLVASHRRGEREARGFQNSLGTVCLCFKKERRGWGGRREERERRKRD